MARVTGIGGVFLRAHDPSALASFYRDVLGLDIEIDTHHAVLTSEPVATTMVFALFSNDDRYLGDPDRQRAMVNFTVDDLDAVVARLAAIGAPVEAVVEESYGRFSWSQDPEGNRFELWEPAPSPGE